MKELTEQQKAFKKMWDTEKFRVASCVDDAVADISESGGDIPKVFMAKPLRVVTQETSERFIA